MPRISFLFVLLVCAAGNASGNISVFSSGRIDLPIFVSAGAAPEERLAAEELARVLGIMSGCAFQVDVEHLPPTRGFYVGRTRTMPAQHLAMTARRDLLDLNAGGIGPDGFSVQCEGGSVFLRGATPEATGFAVSWLLQKQGGVRWYIPGDLGEIIPRRAEWNLSDLNVVREPLYVSREIYGLDGPEAREWARRNGLKARLEFNHSLASIYSQAMLVKHPDWAPLINGLRCPSTSPGDSNWQPNIALPEVAREGARVAGVAFSQEPARISFSLGVNDTVRFDQSGVTQALVEPIRYFRGKPDYSPLVFTFMNRVAEDLSTTRPRAYLGCLAYFWCENTPPFSVNPMVVPYVTTDRSQYYNKGYQAEDSALMSRWGASGVKAFGLWEYGFGEGFLIPREPIAAVAESVLDGWHHGARGYFAEVNPQWGFDAFKVWMLAQLLWEPSRSTDELASDFYEGYYGPAAGPMRRFFDRCEAQWMAQTGAPYWLKLYQQEDQALLFPSEICQELRGLLFEAIRSSAADPAASARVELTSRAFAVTEAYVAFDVQRRKLSLAKTTADGAFVGGEATISDGVGKLIKLRRRLDGAFWSASQGSQPPMSKTAISYFVRDDPVQRLLWLAGRRDPSAPQRLLASAGSAAAEWAPWRVMADAFSRGRMGDGPTLLSNGSFFQTAGKGLGPKFLYPRSGPLPASWELRAMPTERGMAALVPDADSGVPVFRIEGAWDTQLYQWIAAVPGRSYVAIARLRGQSSPGSDSALFMTFLSAEGKVVGTRGMQSLPKGRTQGWHTMALAVGASDQAAWVGAGIGSARQAPGDWLEAAGVELRAVQREENF